MPRFNVEHNGKWACFSTISDEFETPFMSKDEYEKWRLEEYGRANYKPAENCNRMTLDDAVSAIALNHTIEELEECLIYAGFSSDEAIDLLNKELSKLGEGRYRVQILKARAEAMGIIYD